MTRSLALLFVALSVAAVPALATERSSDAPALRSDDGDRLARRRRKKKKKKPPPPVAESAATSAEPLPPASRRGPSRVDFDERLIKGQTNKANAIYLFQRRESRLRTLVKKRKHFHELIDETLE